MTSSKVEAGIRLTVVDVLLAAFALETGFTVALEVVPQILAVSGSRGTRVGVTLVDADAAVPAGEAGVAAVTRVVVREVPAGTVVQTWTPNAVVDVHFTRLSREAGDA